MSQARTITVTRTQNEITFLNQKGKEVFLGTVEVDKYGEDEAKRFLFFPSKENPFVPANKYTEPYQLGIGSSHLQFVNPADAQRVLLDKGFEIVQQFARRGGLQLYTLYKDPNNPFEDIFPYDHDAWAWRKMSVGDNFYKMYPAVSLQTDLRIGYMAARYNRGVYRMVCTNGLIAPIMPYDEVPVRHTDWEVEDKFDALDEMLSTAWSIGPTITTMQHLNNARKILVRFYKESQTEEGLSSQMRLLETQFTGISRNVLKPWALFGYLLHLQYFTKAFSDPNYEVKTIHLVNAYTSAVNAHRLKEGDRGVFAALESMNSVVRTTAALANISAIFI